MCRSIHAAIYYYMDREIKGNERHGGVNAHSLAHETRVVLFDSMHSSSAIKASELLCVKDKN